MGGVHHTRMLSYYCLQTRFVKVIFLQMSVILFMGRGCPGPGLGGRGVQAQAQAQGVYPACTEADTPQQMATAADGTYPTGMHSC